MTLKVNPVAEWFDYPVFSVRKGGGVNGGKHKNLQKRFINILIQTNPNILRRGVTSNVI